MRKELETAGRIVASVAMLPGGAVAEKISPPAQVASINSELFLPGGIINWDKVRESIKLDVTPKQNEKSAASVLNQNSFDLEWSKIAVCDVEPNEVELRVHNMSDVTFNVTGSIFAQDRGGEIKEISSVPEPYQACAPDAWCGPDERIENQYSYFDGDVWGKTEVRYNDVVVAEATMDKTHLHCGTEPTPTPTPTPAWKFEWSNFAVCDEEPNEVEIRAHNLNNVTVDVDGVIYAQHNGGEIKELSSVPEPYRACPPDAWCGPDERIENQYSWFDGDVWGEAVVTYNGTEVASQVMNKTHLECGTEPTATPTATKTSKPTATATPTRTSVGPTATATRTPKATETPKKTSVKPTATERPVVNQTPVAPATGSRESRNGELTAGLLAAGLAAAAIEGIRRKNRKAQS